MLVAKVHLGCACRVEQQPWVWLFSASATDRSQSCCVLQVSYTALQPPGLGLLLSACTRSSTLSRDCFNANCNAWWDFQKPP